ncbi:hypothetical protein [Mycobacterium sp. GA-2829]|uniref:hypothetical protein n=1 Tax=Mycobacterium sp. GA-2829 TaxID=1772283 RepID=UPI0007401424|nr:hypothetical protein [Mycobacterium sp. GA-2829]KUI36241.1 hypothetical protein AU194_16135 [Mycobacterium sp. GA-2829]
MPKKDTQAAVLGMLSTAGAQTRRPVERTPAPEPAAITPEPAPEVAAPEPAPEASVRQLSPRTTPTPRAEETKRTIRLRASTAVELREAWMEAKRDDVLLTVQDFASDLLEDALSRHRRRRTTASK